MHSTAAPSKSIGTTDIHARAFRLWCVLRTFDQSCHQSGKIEFFRKKGFLLRFKVNYRGRYRSYSSARPRVLYFIRRCVRSTFVARSYCG